MKDLHTLFTQRFGGNASTFAAPGRINLIGEHTDYNGGFVFPGAVAQSICADIRPNSTRTVRAFAADLDLYAEFSLDDSQGPADNTFRYLFGVAREMMALGVPVQGFDTVFGGDVPLGAGMSSSAALESCFAFALNTLFATSPLDPMTLARIGQATEHKYVGVKCGIMDQFASIHGKSGHLMRLDCRSGEFQYFPWHPTNYRLLLVNTCVKHQLVGSPYNERRESCERVAATIAQHKKNVQTLRDCSWDDLNAVRSQLSPIDYQRAHFVLGEVDRVLAVSDALQRDDYETVGQQMYLTHNGLSKDYEVSCPELDFLVDFAKQTGVTGSRMMGGGFGGCTINLLPNNLYTHFTTAVKQAYHEKFNIDPQIIDVQIADGARQIN